MTNIVPKKMSYYLGILTFSVAIGLSGHALAETDVKAATAPVVTLKDWSESSEQEQNSFLVGLVSIVELEKEWQGQKGLLPLSQSMIGTWAQGMDGMSINSLRGNVNRYISNNPGEKDKLVLEVLWVNLVQPRIESTSPAAAKDTPKRIRKVMKSQKQKNL